MNAIGATPHPIETLGDAVCGALEAAGYAAATGGVDGFAVFAHTVGDRRYVVVRVVLEGVLLGCGTAGVRRACYYRYEKTLTSAGFNVARYEVAGDAVALVVAGDSEAAEAGLAELQASAEDGPR